ncbi:MAG: hypothetical protein R3C56_16740 [Pirellulaceae bacterium]
MICKRPRKRHAISAKLNAWRLRDELAMELPTLAQWIASPIARLQKKLPSSSDAWRLSQQLIQELAAIQVQLAAGHVPETTQLEAVEQQLENLVGRLF